MHLLFSDICLRHDHIAAASMNLFFSIVFSFTLFGFRAQKTGGLRRRLRKTDCSAYKDPDKLYRINKSPLFISAFWRFFRTAGDLTISPTENISGYVFMAAPFFKFYSQNNPNDHQQQAKTGIAAISEKFRCAICVIWSALCW